MVAFGLMGMETTSKPDDEKLADPLSSSLLLLLLLLLLLERGRLLNLLLPRDCCRCVFLDRNLCGFFLLRDDQGGDLFCCRFSL